MNAALQHAYDPLLECLAIFARRYHRPITIEALISGLPIKPGSIGPELFSVKSSKGLFSRVAKRAGFASRLTRRDLTELSDLLLPCILVLEDRKACILESVDRKEGKAKVILPEISDGEEWVELERLDDKYLGFAFLLKQTYQASEQKHNLLNIGKGHWFWGTLSRAKGIYASIILASVMVNLFVLATPLFTMNVYDRVIPNEAVETLWVLSIGVAIIYFFDTSLRFIRSYLLDVAGKKSDVIMSSILFEQVMNLKMENWPKSIGSFSNRLSQFESIRNFFTASTLVSIIDLPFSLIFLAVIAYIGGPLVAVPLITMALGLLHALLIVRPMRKSVNSVISASAQKNAMLVESLHSVKTIKTLGTSQYAQWAWEESTGLIAASSFKSRQLSGSIAVVSNLLVQLNMVGIIILGFYQIVDLKLSLGGLIAVVILASRAISPMAQVAGLITNYQQTQSAFASIDDLMKQTVERPEEKVFVRRPEFEGSIEFDKVQFTYPDADIESLSDVSFSIKPGEHIGIIGRVGSGKSTLANLLLGLYPPSNGRISIDGIDINQIDPADLRRNIAYLSQDIELFRGTIRENIVMKDPQIEDEHILAAANISGVSSFVNKLPKGFDSLVGEQGYSLSGGQRQCVALARALLLDEPILILDEPTNSMDNSTESLIRDRLYEHTRDKTLLLTTHKAPMLELVERLIVMENGRIILDGPKEKVLESLKGRVDAQA